MPSQPTWTVLARRTPYVHAEIYGEAESVAMSRDDNLMSKNESPPPMRQAGTLRVVDILSGCFPDYSEPGYSIVRIARERWGADTGVHPQTSRFLRILYILDGVCLLGTDGGESRAGPGTLVVAPPDSKHQLWVAPAHDLELYILYLRGENVGTFVDTAGLERAVVVPVLDDGEVEHLLLHMTSHAASSRKGHWPLAHAYVPVLLKLCIMNHRRQPYRDSAAMQHYRRCRSYIDAHYMEVDGFRQVAAACGIHHDHLARIFRHFSGETPGAYIGRLRMAHAARTLLYEEKSMAELAYELGYCDVFAFSKAFKRRFRLSPCKWKRQFS